MHVGSCSTGGTVVTSMDHEYGYQGQLFFHFLRFIAQFFFNARNFLVASTAGKISGETVQPVLALYNLSML